MMTDHLGQSGSRHDEATDARACTADRPSPSPIILHLNISAAFLLSKGDDARTENTIEYIRKRRQRRIGKDESSQGPVGCRQRVCVISRTTAAANYNLICTLPTHALPCQHGIFPQRVYKGRITRPLFVHQPFHGQPSSSIFRAG